MADLESKFSSVIGDRTAKVLTDTFDIKTVGDLMRHYPRRYLVRGELSDISELFEGKSEGKCLILGVNGMCPAYRATLL
jgi:ATP-dependent DNA helicase RecG